MASNPSCCLSLRSRPKARRDSWGLSLKTPKGTLNHPPGPVSARGSFSAQQFCLPGASGSPGFWRPWLSFGRLILLVPIYGDVSKPIVLCIYIIYIIFKFYHVWGTSIYRLFWCSPGSQGFDTSPDMIPEWKAPVWGFGDPKLTLVWKAMRLKALMNWMLTCLKCLSSQNYNSQRVLSVLPERTWLFESFSHVLRRNTFHHPFL